MCVVLWIGTFVCAYLPSAIKASTGTMNLISIFGAGIIIGAAVIIILPEASAILINAQYNLNTLAGIAAHEGEVVDEQMAGTIGTGVMLGFAIMLLVTEVFVIISEKAEEKAAAEKEQGV